MSSPPCSASARSTWTRSRPRWTGTASTATSNGPVPSGSPPRNTRSTGFARPRTATAARFWTPVPCGPRSTRPPTWPACGTSRARPWSSPPGWPGAWPRRASGSAAGASSGPPPSTCSGARTAVPRGRPGVGVFERAPAIALVSDADGVTVRTREGVLRAGQVALATSAFPALLRRLRPYVVPVYDYVLMPEPLSAAQRAAIGWRNRQGIGDSGNQFHYYRLSADDRILWGGYDAIYHFGRGIRAAYDQRAATFATLAAHFFATFPQLEGLGFSHRWGGVIDTCSRFCAFFGTAHRGRVAYALGYTGLGVGASRFGARVMLDLLSGGPTELTGLRLVRSKPVPFPPEPLAYLGIQATRWSLARADRRDGRRNLWLRALDTAGLGFDS